MSDTLAYDKKLDNGTERVEAGEKGDIVNSHGGLDDSNVCSLQFKY